MSGRAALLVGAAKIMAITTLNQLTPRLNKREQQYLTYALWALSGIFFSSIILLFTQYTSNVDEIKVAIMLAGGAWLWLAYIIYLYLAPPPGSRLMPILWPLIGFLAVVVISLLFSNYKWIGWHNLQFYCYTIVILFILASTITTIERLTHACSIFTALTLLSCMFGMAHYYGILENKYLLGPAPPLTSYSMSEITWRNLLITLYGTHEMLGTILNSDFFAAYLIMALPSTLVLIFAAPQLYNRILGLVTAICIAGCIYLTGSNETMLGVLAFMVVFITGYVWTTKGSILHRYWPIFLGIIIFAILVIVWLTWNQIVFRFNTVGGAFSSREIIYGGALQMFYDRPLLGHGPGTFRMMFPVYRSPDYLLHEISHVTLFPHNQFLGLLCETGILGFICFMWFLIALAWGLIREIRKHPNSVTAIYHYAFIGGLIAIHIQNFFSPNSRWVAPAIAYYAMLGLALASIRVSRLALEPPKLLPSDGWTAALLKKPNAWFLPLMVVIVFIIPFSTIYGKNYFVGAVYNNNGLNYTSRLFDNVPNAPQKAEESFTTALSYNPSFLTSYYKLAHFYSQTQPVQSLITYGNISYYNPEYAEIHFNFGMVTFNLYEQYYTIDRAVLTDYAQELNDRLGREYNLDLAALNATGAIAEEQVRQVLDIIKSLNTRDKRLKGLDLHQLIVMANQPEPKKDRLLYEVAMQNMKRARQSTHKPLVWVYSLRWTYLERDYQRAFAILDGILSDDPPPGGKKPIYQWRESEAGEKFNPFQNEVIGIMLNLCSSLNEPDYAVEKMERFIKANPNSLSLVQKLVNFCANFGDEQHQAVALKYIRDLTERNPANWQYHQLAAEYHRIRKNYPQLLEALKLVETIGEKAKQPLLAKAPPGVSFLPERLPELFELRREIGITHDELMNTEEDLAAKELHRQQAIEYLENALNTPIPPSKQAESAIKLRDVQTRLELLKKLNSPTVDK